MIKNYTQYKSVINGVEIFFNFESNCPTNIAKEALFEWLKWIGQIEDHAKANAEAQAKSEETITEKVENLETHEISEA